MYIQNISRDKIEGTKTIWLIITMMKKQIRKKRQILINASGKMPKQDNKQDSRQVFYHNTYDGIWKRAWRIPANDKRMLC